LTQKKFIFEEFELDVLKRQLKREGEIVPLNPKAFDLLFALVENNGRLLSKDDLFRLVWEDQIVEESNLTVNMSAIRRALGEKASQPRFITTVSGQGYRFVGDVRESGEPAEETIIESRTLARIVVEEVVETDEKTAEISPVEKPAALPPAPESFLKKHRFAIIGSILILALISGIGGYLRRKETAKSSAPLQAISMKRLTNLGNVTNAALSPDGKLFAYSLQEKDGRRSLWLGHVDGGSENVNLRPASEITIHGIAFAPDGGSVFYIITSDEFERGALFKMRVFGGAPEKVRENIENFIAFSPDGKQFVFVRNDRENRKSSLMIAETGGAGEREIASRPIGLSFIATSPAWSPDGSKIAVSAIADENANTNEIFTVAAADGSLKPVTDLGWNGIRALIWTKDGSGLYGVAGERDASWELQIWHVSYPDGEPRRIVSDLNVYGAVLGLSPTGNDLLVLQAQHSSNIWVAPADNFGAAKQVTFELLGRKSGWDALEWTVDGRIAYTAFSDAGETIWLMDADGKNQKQIIPEGRANSHLSFSADGKKMVFDSNRGGGWEVWTAGGDGSNMRQLTTGGKNLQPHISPGGDWIVYRSTRDDASRLWRVASGGGEPLQLTENPASWARFSPDGKFIACLYQTDEKTKLAVLDFETGQPVRLFDFPQSANFNNGIRWTPDGASLTYRDWNNGIWRQNLAGDEPKRLADLPEEKLYAYGWSPDGKQFAFTRGMEIRDAVLISRIR
jgi:Tol biopolymer transport system component/DNA-binding winged helix-turn-helix (wHTH) protein